PILSGDRTKAVTPCPHASARSTSCLPIPPVAPRMSNRISLSPERTPCMDHPSNLVGRGRNPFGWALHQENKRNHHQSGQAQEPEIVEVRDHVRLPENDSVQLPVRLMLRGYGATRREALAHALHRVVELAAVRRGVSG